MHRLSDGYPEEHACSCGHIWLVIYCIPTGRSENLVCSCGIIFGNSSNGSMTAVLLSAKERFAALRKLRYLVGVGLLQAANALKIKLPQNSWLHPRRIVAYRHTNTPVRTYARITKHSKTQNHPQ
ncbi:hypothetical protein HDF16_004944 [Granulicella aggregans]|uniref:Uncharacterized protein n=1 Tax=Granulicella aggregans TaxID=474949 RepID=A0A7W7ZI76_9BACT|nr:hypothetical protein [Granulicella aggregans]